MRDGRVKQRLVQGLQRGLREWGLTRRRRDTEEDQENEDPRTPATADCIGGFCSVCKTWPLPSGQPPEDSPAPKDSTNRKAVPQVRDGLVLSTGWSADHFFFEAAALRFSSIAAWAAARRATGTRNGEQLT